MKSWRNLPVALQAFFAVEVLSTLAYAAYAATRHEMTDSARISLVDGGLYFAANVLAVVGFMDLARRTTGRLALGFKITALGFGLAIALQMWWHGFIAVQPQWNFHTMEKIEEWTRFVPRFVPLFSAIIAASASRRRLAIVGTLALIVSDPLPIVGRHTYGWLLTGYGSYMMLMEVLHLIELGALFLIVSRLATSGIAAPARDGASGLRTVAAGLWLRVIAACTMVGLTLLLALGRGEDGALSVLKLATISSAIVGCISFAMIARGTFGALVADLPALPLVLASTAMLWCLGVTLGQLPYTYKLLYGHSDYGFGGSEGREYAEALSIAAPIIAIAAIAAVANAISGFAARRGLEQLRSEAQSRGIGFVALMLTGIAAQSWLLPQMRSEGSAVFMMLAAAGCSLWATVLMARLCALAADSLGSDPGLPTATLQA
jgi:hypothetical protein